MIIIEQLLHKANEIGASDIHITVGLPPRARVNGELKNLDYPKMLPDDTEKLVTSLMNDMQYQCFKKNGEVEFTFSAASIGRYRVNAFRQQGYAACVLRVIAQKIPSVKELGIPDEVAGLGEKNSGLVIVTGAAGSGRTTTVASIIDKINENRMAHIITLEKPVEYVHEHKKSMINHREIGSDTASYSEALKYVLRQNPDVIVVGEMRDMDTISAVLEAAEAGCLVFSTMYTTSAENAIDRIIDVFPNDRQQQIRNRLAAVLEAVVVQKLVPAADGSGRAAEFKVVNAVAVKKLIKEA